MMKFYDNEPQTPTTRHCEPALALTRHSEGATATEESTPLRHCEPALALTRHSEGATATEESTNGKNPVILSLSQKGEESTPKIKGDFYSMDSSLRATHSAQNDGLPCHSERNEVERRIHFRIKGKQ